METTGRYRLVLASSCAVNMSTNAHTLAGRENGVNTAAGHTCQVDFGGGNAFEIAFGHKADMTFTKLQEPNKGQVETIHYTHKKLREGLYMR